VGFWRDHKAALIPNALGHLLTPSAVGVGDDGAILVGLAARERLSTHPKPTTAVFRAVADGRLLPTSSRRCPQLF
jgi:molecular chaperone HscC